MDARNQSSSEQILVQKQVVNSGREQCARTRGEGSMPERRVRINEWPNADPAEYRHSAIN